VIKSVLKLFFLIGGEERAKKRWQVLSPMSIAAAMVWQNSILHVEKKSQALPDATLEKRVIPNNTLVSKNRGCIAIIFFFPNADECDHWGVRRDMARAMASRTTRQPSVVVKIGRLRTWFLFFICYANLYKNLPFSAWLRNVNFAVWRGEFCHTIQPKLAKICIQQTFR